MKSILLCSSLGGLLTASALLAQNVSTLANINPPVKVRFTITDLGPVGGPPGQPTVITNNGLIAGGAATSGSAWHAMFWYHGAQVDIGKTGLGGSSMAFGTDERGDAVGEAESANFDVAKEDFCGFGSGHQCLPFVWQYGIMSPLPLLKDSTGASGKNGVANAINNRGTVVGQAENTTLDSTCPPYDTALLQYQKFQFKPVMWSGGSIQALPTAGNDPDGIALSINDKGQAVGATGTCTAFQASGDLTYLYGQHATLWQDGQVIDLGNLGGIAPGGGNVALHINNRGQVVGSSGTAGGSFHAFLWSKQTGIMDLGAVGDDVASVGLGNNDNGDIVGISFDQDFNGRAFYRPDGGAPVDLNSLVAGTTPLFLFDACSINSSGQIIGFGFDQAGNAHGFLATPRY